MAGLVPGIMVKPVSAGPAPVVRRWLLGPCQRACQPPGLGAGMVPAIMVRPVSAGRQAVLRPVGSQVRCRVRVVVGVHNRHHPAGAAPPCPGATAAGAPIGLQEDLDVIITQEEFARLTTLGDLETLLRDRRLT